MYRIQTLNQISVKGLDLFARDHYEVASELSHPDAVLLRSHKLDATDVPDSLKAIARAGAGVNNIDVAGYTELGIPVFNTPGANANAVKELVLAALLLASRGIMEGVEWVRGLQEQDAAELHKQVEAEKKRFKGHEIQGKTLGVVGLGAIGSRVAEMALGLGMKVVGYDPALSVEAAWRLPSQVAKMENLPALMARSDFVTLHLPLLDATRNLVNEELLRTARPGMKLLNFARDGIVDDEAVVAALEAGTLSGYLSDFPAPVLQGVEGVVSMPHIGASTAESEDNCAVMAARQLIDFLENGNIVNSVNFPSLVLERTEGYRMAVTNRNVPRMLGQVLAVLADAEINVIDMLNKSRDDVAYNLLDLETEPDESVLSTIRGIEGVVNVRMIDAAASD